MIHNKGWSNLGLPKPSSNLSFLKIFYKNKESIILVIIKKITIISYYLAKSKKLN